MPIVFIFSLLFSALVVVFALHNSDVVTINFLVGQYNLSQALVILLSAACGAIIVSLLSVFSQIKLKIKIRKLTKAIDKTEAENRALKEKEELARVERLEEENRLLKEKDDKKDAPEENREEQVDDTVTR